MYEMLGSLGPGDCSECGQHSNGLWPKRRCAPCWTRFVNERRTRVNASQTVLYRLYDEHDNLLYVGRTLDPRTRWKEHRTTMPWWPDVYRKHLELYDTGVEAGRAETAAIRAELPWYNKSGFGFDENDQPLWPNVPPGCPPQPCHGYRPAQPSKCLCDWFEWRAVFRDFHLNPEERASLGR